MAEPVLRVCLKSSGGGDVLCFSFRHGDCDNCESRTLGKQGLGQKHLGSQGEGVGAVITGK